MIIEPVVARRAFLRAGLGLAVAAPWLVLAPGCGDELPPGFSRKIMKVDEVPADVRKVAEKSLPGVTFQDAWANVDKDGKTHSYEIRGRAKNGKIREARISPSGDVLEME